MSRVAVIGVGQSTFVRSYPGSIRELAFEAYSEAMKDANIQNSDVDATVMCSAPEYDKQRSPAGVVAEYLGLNPQPTFYVETLCSSSSTGLKLAYSLVASGLHDCVMVLGFQIMSQLTSNESQERMGRGADIQWESTFGTMMPAYYALHAQAHFARYGTKPEDLANIRVKSATYGVLNDRAVYRKPVAHEDFLVPRRWADRSPALCAWETAAQTPTAVPASSSPTKRRRRDSARSLSGFSASAPLRPRSTWSGVNL